MKILLLTDGITPFVTGGMQRHSQLTAENLALIGHQVTLFHYAEKDVDANIEQAFSEEAQKNIQVVFFEYSDPIKLPGHYLRAQRRIARRYLEKYKSMNETYDFIFCKGFVGEAILNHRKELRIQAPIGVKLHGMNMFQPQGNLKTEIQKYYFQGATRNILKSADFVFSYGGKITEIIKKECDTEVIEVPAGIETEWIRKDIKTVGDKLKFIFIGRYDRVKGLPELNKALERLSRTENNWEFHFVGPIPSSKWLRLDNCVYHGGIYRKEELIAIIDSCDIVVCTSISEGMPNVILEGMARGLAVMATDVGATSLLVDQNGVLIPSCNSELILSALRYFLRMNPNSLMEMKRNSLENIKYFEWSKISFRLAESIEQAVTIFQEHH